MALRKGHKQPHFINQRGKRVRVWLSDGAVIRDRFIEHNDREIILQDHGRIHKARIRAFAIDRSG